MSKHDAHRSCSMTFTDLRRLGYDPIPLHPGQKNPIGKAWQKRVWSDEELAEQDQSRNGIGLRGGVLRGFDIDIRDEACAVAVEEALRSEFKLNGTPTRIGLPPKRLLPLRAVQEGVKKKVVLYRVGPDGKSVLEPPVFDPAADKMVPGKQPCIEVLGKGQQFVVSGIHPDTQQPYHWSGELPAFDHLPELGEADVDRALALAVEVAARYGYTTVAPGKEGMPEKARERAQEQRSDAAVEKPHPVHEPLAQRVMLAKACLDAIPNDQEGALDWDAWKEVAGSLRHFLFDAPAEGQRLWEEFSRRHPRYDAKETAKGWKHAATFTKLTFGSLMQKARDALGNPDWHPVDSINLTAAPAKKKPKAEELSDEALTERYRHVGTYFPQGPFADKPVHEVGSPGWIEYVRTEFAARDLAAGIVPLTDAQLVEKYRDHPEQPSFGDGKPMEVGSTFWLAHFRRGEAKAAAVAQEEEEQEAAEEPLPYFRFDAPAPRISTPVVEHWLPRGVVTLFGAHGGVGKSFTALEVSVRVALGEPVFGCETEQGRVLFYSCEDEEAVLRWRADKLAVEFGHEPKELSGVLLPVDMTRAGDVELYKELPRVGGGAVTPMFKRLMNSVEEYRPALVVLDNASDVFAANENARAMVRDFMRQLKGLAQEFDCAVLLLAHTNKATAGATAGEDVQGYSGSTAWHNSARSRWYMAREQGEREKLVLSLEKSNYGRSGMSVDVQWHDDKKLLLSGEPRSNVALSDLTATILTKLVEWSDAGIELKAGLRGTGSTQAALRKDVPELKGRKPTAVQETLEKLYRDGYLELENRAAARSKSGIRVSLFIVTEKGRETVRRHAGLMDKLRPGEA